MRYLQPGLYTILDKLSSESLCIPYIKTNDINLYYETYGEGQPLVCIAGLGFDISSWYCVLGLLSKHYQVILIDNRGSGRSDSPDYPYSIEMMAQDVVDVLQNLNISQAHVLGHSMGGFIAQVLAHLHPTVLNKLVLYSTSAKNLRKTWYFFKGFLELRKQYRDIPNETLLKLFLPWGYTEEFLANQSVMDNFMQVILAYPYLQSTTGFINQTYACLEHDTTAVLSTIKSPTLVLVGDEDQITPQSCAEYLAANIPNSQLKISQGGHNWHIEHPNTFSQQIIEFLR